ncbi:MAG: hypothetical protein KGL39_48910 [Patescibacteria group bacterium]|nr:hypothetical protein [Patescibacteria group bacterium]
MSATHLTGPIFAGNVLQSDGTGNLAGVGGSAGTANVGQTVMAQSQVVTQASGATTIVIPAQSQITRITLMVTTAWTGAATTLGLGTTVSATALTLAGAVAGGSLLSAPVLGNLSTATTGGTLAAATYYYKVTALGATGETIGSNEASITTTGTTSTVTLTWSAVVGATGYRVYRGTSAGGESVYYAPGNVTTYTDTNAASTGGTPPTANTAISLGLVTITPGTGATQIGNWDNVGLNDIQIALTSTNTGSGVGTLTVEYVQSNNLAS